MARKTYTSADLKGKKLVISRNSSGVNTGSKVVNKKSSSSSSKKSSSSKPSSAQSTALAAGAGPLSKEAAQNFVNAQSTESPISVGGGVSLSSPQADATTNSSERAEAFGLGRGGEIAPAESRTPIVSDFMAGFSSLSSVDDAGRDLLTKSTSEIAGYVAGKVGALASVYSIGSALAEVQTFNALDKAFRTGRVVKDAATATAETVPVNSVNIVKTGSWLQKLGFTTGVGALMGAIGSYPFAGFIKEEALQTLGFGVKTAIDNGDFEGAERALAEQEEILNPAGWNKLLGYIPYANVLTNLRDFYGSATTKMAIDREVVNTLKDKEANGETDAEMYARIAEERAAAKAEERAADEEYYAQIERNRLAAKEAERAADERYWNKILSEREKSAKANEKFDEDYWSEYYKALAKARDNSAPSNLKFGLL